MGERGRPALERLWARPTADVNGVWGGYAGPGSKTVVPAEAGAKVSFRLVPDQDPQAVVAAFRRFVAERSPSDAKAGWSVLGLAPGVKIPSDTRWARDGRHAARQTRPAPVRAGSNSGSSATGAPRRRSGRIGALGETGQAASKRAS